MTNEVEQLVQETIDLTGADAPAMLDEDAPVLRAADQGQTYLIGLVGGKDVGKSSLVNALVGRPISRPTSFGPGTESAVAYAHGGVADEIREMLEREVPGRFTIVGHTIDHLRRQVLLDLPDIDSKYDDHIQITRRMLRHMLYPLWIQSVEKYADLRPQELLAAVAEGNDPANFIFCLNKADYLSETQAAEVRVDYATRLARALKLATPPQVYLISATNPHRFDLPALRDRLSREKPTKTVKESLDLAERRQDMSLLRWLGSQRLDDRAEQLARLERDAEEMTAGRIALPMLQRAIPAMLDDPGQRMMLLASAVQQRLARWPVVNAIDALLSPLLALLQRNLSKSGNGSCDPDVYLGGGSVSTMVQTTFAQLHQLHPQAGDIYRERKLWESIPADTAAADLRRRFALAVERQRQAVVARSSRWSDVLLAPWRWLLTVGAILWFPFVQPLLSVMLQQDAWQFTKRTLLVVVDMLSVGHLLQCAAFLLIWFVVLWAYLRFSTQRSIARRVQRWKTDDDASDELSLAGQTLQWSRGLLEPIRRRRERFENLSDRTRQLTAAATGADSAAAGRAAQPATSI